MIGSVTGFTSQQDPPQLVSRVCGLWAAKNFRRCPQPRQNHIRDWAGGGAAPQQPCRTRGTGFAAASFFAREPPEEKKKGRVNTTDGVDVHGAPSTPPPPPHKPTGIASWCQRPGHAAYPPARPASRQSQASHPRVGRADGHRTVGQPPLPGHDGAGVRRRRRRTRRRRVNARCSGRHLACAAARAAAAHTIGRRVCPRGMHGGYRAHHGRPWAEGAGGGHAGTSGQCRPSRWRACGAGRLRHDPPPPARPSAARTSGSCASAG